MGFIYVNSQTPLIYVVQAIKQYHTVNVKLSQFLNEFSQN